jgi:death-on-curing protein
LAALAAAYGIGITRNGPFGHGNKTAGLLAVGLFLRLNGHQLQASQAEAIAAILALSAGELEEAVFAEWLRCHLITYRFRIGYAAELASDSGGGFGKREETG